MDNEYVKTNRGFPSISPSFCHVCKALEVNFHNQQYFLGTSGDQDEYNGISQYHVTPVSYQEFVAPKTSLDIIISEYIRNLM